jgi:hypothetical protein
MIEPKVDAQSSEGLESIFDRLSRAAEYARAGIVIPQEEARKLLQRPHELKAAILACWLTQEQGCSDWVDDLPFPPEVEFETLIAWANRCGAFTQE